MTEKVSWRRLVAEIVLAETLPMPTSIELIGDPNDDDSHLSLWTFSEADKAVWQQLVDENASVGNWHGWDVLVDCVPRRMPADLLDDDTRATLTALAETE
jgi:hypothetical protein